MVTSISSALSASTEVSISTVVSYPGTASASTVSLVTSSSLLTSMITTSFSGAPSVSAAASITTVSSFSAGVSTITISVVASGVSSSSFVTFSESDGTPFGSRCLNSVFQFGWSFRNFSLYPFTLWADFLLLISLAISTLKPVPTTNSACINFSTVSSSQCRGCESMDVFRELSPARRAYCAAAC